MLDDDYVDREKTPRDAAGEYGYEAFEALRIDPLHSHLARLLGGETDDPMALECPVRWLRGSSLAPHVTRTSRSR